MIRGGGTGFPLPKYGLGGDAKRRGAAPFIQGRRLRLAGCPWRRLVTDVTDDASRNIALARPIDCVAVLLTTAGCNVMASLVISVLSVRS